MGASRAGAARSPPRVCRRGSALLTERAKWVRQKKLPESLLSFFRFFFPFFFFLLAWRWVFLSLLLRSPAISGCKSHTLPPSSLWKLAKKKNKKKKKIDLLRAGAGEREREEGRAECRRARQDGHTPGAAPRSTAQPRAAPHLFARPAPGAAPGSGRTPAAPPPPLLACAVPPRRPAPEGSEEAP